MLVLTRREEQSIVIRVPGVHEPIVVMVLSVRRRGHSTNGVRLGIAAPRSVVVDREEVDDNKARERSGQWG